ncbi:MFS transporter [Halotalea alkalilenta]|uniref:MFS transporter n=1 Tax=Halotalea alkalilenta TaxID=376489 RepID=A0A172YGU5_9GAMM|nr:MFS transporter [Halotalea alkalilenta]ANF58165.1 MFS transporter [Halotalea alkalilenta]
MTIPANRPALPFTQALLAMLGISLVLMLAALDQTVIGNALPHIVADLNGFDFYAWIGTGYLLTSIVTIPIFGRMGDYYGRKPFVIAATLIFTLASLACALASDMRFLVAARALQGVGGGMLIGTAFACVPDLFPDTRQRLRWQVLLSAAFSVVNALGPSLGGFLTGYYGWRFVFYLNLPLGLLALFFAWRYLPWYRPETSKPISLDWFGALLIAITLGSLQLFVEWLPRAGAGGAVLLMGGASLGAAALLWWWERRAPAPLMPPALFAVKGLRTLFGLSVMVGSVMFALLFYMPLLFQGSYGYSPQDAGVLITPMVLSITLGAIVNSRVISRLRNPNWLPRAGFIALLLACVGLSLCGREASFGLLLGLMLLAGMGLGFILLNLTLFTQTLAERRHLGIATALLQSLRLVGGLLGTAGMGTLTTFLYRRELERSFAELDQSSALSMFSDPQVLLKAVPAGIDPQLVDAAREALTHAISVGLGGAVLIAAVSLWNLWRMSPVALFSPSGSPQSAKVAGESGMKRPEAE